MGHKPNHLIASSAGCVAAALTLLAVSLIPCHGFSITDFGGVPFDSSNGASATNAAAFFKTILAANASDSDRVAEVPAGQNFTVFSLPGISNLINVSIVINGALIVNDNLTAPEWAVQQSAIINIDGGCVAGVGSPLRRCAP
jgi:hypothetical protein